MTSLAVQPAPAPPTWKMFPAIAASSGRYLAKTALSPPTITVIVGGRPLTGASSMSMPRARQASATRRAIAGAFVVMSM